MALTVRLALSVLMWDPALNLGFPGGSAGKEPACNAGDRGSIPGLGRSPGGGHGKLTPVFLPGESPWTEEPGGLQSTRLQRDGHDSSD